MTVLWTGFSALRFASSVFVPLRQLAHIALPREKYPQLLLSFCFFDSNRDESKIKSFVFTQTKQKVELILTGKMHPKPIASLQHDESRKETDYSLAKIKTNTQTKNKMQDIYDDFESDESWWREEVAKRDLPQIEALEEELQQTLRNRRGKSDF